jgi:mannosyltransferase
MLKIRPDYKFNFALISILCIGAFFRFYGLTREGLWVDELITMNEVDPSIPWGKMFEFLSIADPHPPLFFILERITCSIFGHTDGVARGLNAVLGSISILFIYYLGKEILNKKLGYVAAILLCVNYYSIYYSQEGRDYSLALCTSILANLFFIKLLKAPTYRRSFLYAFFALLLLYTHYFGLFIIAGHGLLVIALMFAKSGLQKTVYRYFFVVAAAILIGYIPWLPSFLKQLKVTSFWIPPIPENFATLYFFEYFGNAIILEPILILILLFYCWQVYSNYQELDNKNITDDPLHLSFSVIFFTVFITFYIPYLRSVWVVPMLLARYTIVLIPAFLIAIAYGLILIKSSHIRTYILISVVVLSIIHLIFNKKFYSAKVLTKTQFREASQFMKQVGGAYPLIESGSTIWPHGYYLHQNNYHLPTFWGIDKVDSVLRSPFKRYQVDGFWLFGALPDERHLSPEMQQSVDSAFTLAQSKTFFQAWAQLYVRKTGSWNTIFISPFDFDQNVLRQSFDAVVQLEDVLESKPILLKSRKYRMLIEQSGIKVKDQLPQVSVHLMGKKIGEITCNEYPYYGERELTFTAESSNMARVRLQIDNKLTGSDEKRLAYIRFIRIIPIVD